MGSGAHGTRDRPLLASRPVSILVWTMVGVAVWHFAVLVPDRFVGGIIGAFLAAVAGALVTGLRAARARRAGGQSAGVSGGAVRGPRLVRRLAGSYWCGARREAFRTPR